MALGTLDRDLKELSSTKGLNFAYLINRYTYRRDAIPDKLLKKRSALEVLCRLNERVCKKAELEEMALSWKSLASLGRDIMEIKLKIKTA